MDAKNRRAKAKLERRNAAKHIDYDALASSTSTTTSSSSSSSSCPTFDDFSVYTSFRVKGVDGEFDLICRSLGLSGPEDFSIPLDAWESCKARDLTPRSRLRRTLVAAPPSGAGAVESQRGADVLAAKVGSIEVGSEGRRLSGDDGCELDGVVNRDRVSCRSPLQHEATEGFGLSDSLGFPSSFEPKGRWDGGSGELDRAGGGIKGLRPPVLAPPPVTSRPVVDNVSSTWDLFRSFGPQDDQIGNRNSPVGPLRGEGWVDDGDDGKLDQQRITERKDAPNSCSLASVEDDEYEYKDDVASTVTSSILETEHSVSLNGSFRQRITSWQRGELLGSGSFGTVYEGFTDDGLFFAVKEVSLLDQGTQGKQSVLQLEQEISLLSQFEHDNIVRYLGTDKDDKKLYIFLELVTKGSLAKLYQKYELRDSQVSVYTRQILQGLKYLHEKNVVHRDIKCANILVDASGSVKLADFGLAKATKISDAKSCKGTAFWMAPEVVNLRNKSYGLAADIWSLGCTVLEMLTRQPPYSHLEGMQALYRIGKGEPPEVPDSLSRDARHFILKCLQVNPNNRPTAVQLLDHSFVRKPPTSVGFASPGSNNIWS